MTMKRVLVPIDFSRDSLAALDYAVEFTKPFDAELLLLHVIEPVYYATPADLYATSPNLALLLEEQRRSAHQQLEKLVRKLTQRGRKARALLKQGTPAQVIAESAGQTPKADLIIMATHGRTGLAHMLLGSVTERVLRIASCPVLVVRAPKRRSAKARRA